MHAVLDDKLGAQREADTSVAAGDEDLAGGHGVKKVRCAVALGWAL